MAWASAKTGESVWGNKRVHWGTYSQGNGDTGGTISTGLYSPEVILLSGPEVLTITWAAGVATILTIDPAAAQNGYWLAIGM